MQLRLGGLSFFSPSLAGRRSSGTSRVPPPALGEASQWKRPASVPAFPYGNMAPPCAGAARRRATARLAHFGGHGASPPRLSVEKHGASQLSHVPRLSVRKHGVAFRRAGASWLKAASPLQTRMSDCGGRSPPDAGGEDSEGCGLSGAEAEPPCPPRIAPRPNLRPSSRSENADSAAGEGCGRGGWQPSGARPGSTRSKSPAFLRLFPSGGGDVGCRRGRGRDSGRVKV